MLRVAGAVKALIVSRHKPKEICLIAGCRNCGMISLGEFHKLVVLYSVSLIYLSVSGVETLHSKALLGVEEEVVYLLSYALCGHIVLIVLVRGEACPVTLGAVCLANGKHLSVAVAVDNKAGLSLIRNLSEEL